MEVMKMGPTTVALRRGSQGAILGTNEGIFEGEAKKVRVADTVGAGDAFTASLLCCNLENLGTQEALEFALRAAALTCTATGSTEGQPTRKQIMDFSGGNPVIQ